MMIFFLEVPHTNQIIPQDNEIQDPVHGLPHYTKDLNLQKTTIMDCETRKVEGAASILLSFRPERLARLLSFMTPDYDGPHKQFARDCITFFGCRFDTLTFQDLLTDHTRWFQGCIEYRDSWSEERIKKAFNQRLRSSHYAGVHLREVLASESIDLNRKIHEYASEYWDRHTSRNQELLTALSEAFSDFLDMYMLHQLLLLRNNATYRSIVLCTGSTHARNIARALQQSGYREICDPLDNVQTGIITPDQIKELLLPREEQEADCCTCLVM